MIEELSPLGPQLRFDLKNFSGPDGKRRRSPNCREVHKTVVGAKAALVLIEAIAAISLSELAIWLT